MIVARKIEISNSCPARPYVLSIKYLLLMAFADVGKPSDANR